MYDVFLSFDGKYRTLAEKIKSELETKYKLNVFIDYELTAKDDRFQSIEKIIDNSLYMLVLYSKEYETNVWCVKEFIYSKKIAKLIFIVDDKVKEINQNILKDNKKEDDYLIKGRFQEAKKIAKIVIKKIVNENIIFDFKKKFNFEYTSDKILFKKIIYSYILIIFSSAIFVLFASFNQSKSQITEQIHLLNDSITITKFKTKNKFAIPNKNEFKNFLKSVNNDKESILSLLLTLSGIYWLIFFKIYKKQYIDILFFFDEKIRDVEYIFIILALSLPLEFIAEINNFKYLSDTLILIINFIIFFVPLYLAWLSSIFINYKIAFVNYKYFVKVKNIYTQKIISYPFKKLKFNNSDLNKCLNKDENFNKWYLFIIAFYFIFKDLYYRILFPIKKLKFCTIDNIVYIDESLKKYLELKKSINAKHNKKKI